MESAHIDIFHLYQEKLDAKNDKYERIVKMSRDITIESKRLIFQIHRCDNDNTIDQRFAKLKNNIWYYLCKDLEGESGYQFLRAYSPGLQEYIEALAFHHYLKTGNLISLKEVETDLTFFSKSGNQDEGKDEQVHKVLIPPSEYFSGLADFSGELMRYCISSVSKNGFEVSEKICCFLRSLFEGFSSLTGLSRDLGKKVHVLKMSLVKVENALYTMKLRGSEMPTEHLMFVIKENNYKIEDCENYEGEFY